MTCSILGRSGTEESGATSEVYVFALDHDSEVFLSDLESCASVRGFHADMGVAEEKSAADLGTVNLSADEPHLDRVVPPESIGHVEDDVESDVPGVRRYVEARQLTYGQRGTRPEQVIECRDVQVVRQPCRIHDSRSFLDVASQGSVQILQPPQERPTPSNRSDAVMDMLTSVAVILELAGEVDDACQDPFINQIGQQLVQIGQQTRDDRAAMLVQRVVTVHLLGQRGPSHGDLHQQV